jgi:FlaA1/EpsC-like NDP-sugar epimerase
MNENGYYRNDILNHEEWAVFYSYIKLDKNTNSNDNSVAKLQSNLHYLNEVKHYLVEREKKYKNLEIDNDSKTFIFPAGHYGQLAYYFLNDNVKKNIVGFIDGDKFKIGKRVYGTKYYTFEKCEISKYENINIIICSERYRSEMIEEIKLLNKNAKIINI